jgi:hypothetical protein
LASITSGRGRYKRRITNQMRSGGHGSQTVQAKFDLTEEEADRIAVEEVRSHRRERGRVE